MKICGLVGLSLLMTQTAFAADMKVGVVDLQKALSQTKAGAKAQKDFEAEIKSLQTDIDKKKNEYETK